MPDYDFRCKACSHEFTLTFDSIEAVDAAEPRCPRCQSLELSRVIRQVAVLTSEEARLERLSDPSRLAGLEDDPRTMGRLMREMVGEMGEDAGPEMVEAIERLEAGESLESVEQSLAADSGSEAADSSLDASL